MKSKSEKKVAAKFGLEKFEIAKLKNSIIIKGGGDDPVDTNNTTKELSGIKCVKSN